MRLTARLVAACEAAAAELLRPSVSTNAHGSDGPLGHENIVGVAVTRRRVGGVHTGSPAIGVFVDRKAGVNEVVPEAEVPTSYFGIPTDVIGSGGFCAHSQRDRHRPARSGMSIGHYDGMTGTLGCLARRGSDLFILSNNHVLARENWAAVGDPILQPGSRDGGRLRDGGPADDVVAHLAEWIPLDRAMPNLVDAALAITDPALVASGVHDSSTPLRVPGVPRVGATVWKYGRTTALSAGVVTGVDAKTKMRYPRGPIMLTGQFYVEGLHGRPFSEEGDSGALVVEESTGRPVGLLCGGSARVSVATPISTVLQAFGVTLA